MERRPGGRAPPPAPRAEAGASPPWRASTTAGSSQVAALGSGRAGGRAGTAGPQRPRGAPGPCAAPRPVLGRRPSAARAGPRRAGTGLGWGWGRPPGRYRAPEGMWSRCEGSGGSSRSGALRGVWFCSRPPCPGAHRRCSALLGVICLPGHPSRLSGRFLALGDVTEFYFLNN